MPTQFDTEPRLIENWRPPSTSRKGRLLRTLLPFLMRNSMSDLKLEDAVNDFLVQVSTYLLKAEPSCRVYMIQPSGSEFNREFPLPLEEVEQFLRSFIFGGSCAAIRAFSNKDAEEELQIVIWDDQNDSFGHPNWPNSYGKATNMWIWNGVSQDSE